MTSDSEESTNSENSNETPDLQAEMDAFIEGAAGLFGNLKEIFLKSKEEVARGAQIGKVRIDVFQLRKDREHFMQRLGEETYDLLQREELAHADLEKPYAKVLELDERIVAVESEIEALVEEQQAASEAANEGEAEGGEAVEDA
jgi:hypothetical protein